MKKLLMCCFVMTAITACGGGGGSSKQNVVSSQKVSSIVSSSADSPFVSSSVNSNNSSAESSAGEGGSAVSQASSVAQSTVSSFSSQHSSANSSSMSSTSGLLVPPELSLAYQQTKNFHFSWPSVTGATSYRLHEDIDGNSGYTDVSGGLSAANNSYDLTVPLYKRITARYLLEACKSADCVDSNLVSINANLSDAAGYIKPESTVTRAFGSALAISQDGSTLAIAAINDPTSATGIGGNENMAGDNKGAVFIYVRDGKNWIKQTYIKAPAIIDDLYFGSSVSLSADGNTLVVGSISVGVDQTTTTYVYTRTNNTWQQQAALNGPEGVAYFGESVSLSNDGNILAIGASSIDSEDTYIGAVYLYSRTGNSWSSPVTLRPSNSSASDYFGRAVALSGDGSLLAVGASRVNNKGVVYTYRKNNSNNWVEEASITTASLSINDQFGSAIAVNNSGTLLAITALLEDSNATGLNGDETNNAAKDSGAVFIFHKSGNAYQKVAYLKPLTAVAENTYFGSSIAFNSSGTELAIGLRIFNDNNPDGVTALPPVTSPAVGQNGSAIYFLQRPANNVGGWIYKAYMQETNNNQSAGGINLFSDIALSGDGDTLVLGDRWDDGQSLDAGAVYIY